MSEIPLRFMVVDDSPVYRVMLREILSQMDGVEVVTSASNGKMALDKLKTNKIDVVTMDLEMPIMDGMTFLDELKQQHTKPIVVMLSAMSAAENTLNALTKGAMDFVTKPDHDDPKECKIHLLGQLENVVRAARGRLRAKRAPASPKPIEQEAVTPARNIPKKLPRAVVIAVSTGGPEALRKLLPQFPAHFKLPILIVQHMPPNFTEALANRLNDICELSVKEAAEGDRVEAGKVYIAPGGFHMRVDREASGAVTIHITNDPPENNCRPAANVLFRSASRAYDGSLTAVIMTGMGNDGTRGASLIQRRGGRVIAQDRESSTVYGMPMEAMKAQVVDRQVSLSNLADEIIRGHLK